VRVIGTRFDLHWDPITEQIDLRLREGSVEVRSPLADGPIVVRAGQRFRAAMNQRSMFVTDAEAPEPPNAPPAATPSIEPAPMAPAAAGAASPKSSPRRESWQDLVTHGEFESVVASANARGIDACVTSCSAADLRSLADAARYTGRADLADKVLLALRRRFPGTGQSAAAAFLLGHTYEPRSPAAAERWYETYLYESPEGEFAAEALAGKMRVIAARSGAAAAKPLALEYLRRYPQGVQVKTARKIAGLD
jgi:transmembrane sensor